MLMRLPSWVGDLVLAGAIGATSIAQAFHNGRHVWLTAPVCVLAAIAILARRRWPLWVLAFETAAATLIVVALGGGWLLVAVPFAIYTVAVHRDRATSLRAALVSTAVLSVPSLHAAHWHPLRLIAPAVFAAGAWLLGDNIAARNRERERGIRQAALDERARIVRELHDVVTHNVSVMVVQAAAGNDVFDERPDRAREALVAVEETGRRALAELRRLFDVVADDEVEVELAPQPSLAGLGELVEIVRRGGLETQLLIEGTPRPLPEGVELSTYRIVQEALTNTLKHAHAEHAIVRVRYAADAIEVEVTDDGVGAPAPNAGRGLVGMRERVALFGGDLLTGARPGGGFAVHARMPAEAL